MRRVSVVLEALRYMFWVLPTIGIAIAIAAALLLPGIDDSVQLPDAVSFSGGPDTARTVLQMIATVGVSVAGISFSVIVVALVLASQQLSPRVMRSFQRHPLNQTVLGLFLGTAAFSLFVLGSVGDSGDEVPELAVTIAMLLAALSLAVFAVFLHHLVRSLNASAVIRRIAAEGHQAVDRPYPTDAGEPAGDLDAAERQLRESRARWRCREVRAPRAGYVASVQAVDLLAAADRCDGFVEQRLAIGDFTVSGGLLALAWAGEEELERFAARVRQGFVLSEERVVDNDVAFPLRQLADVALKGLSPSVNDPTTAENAMDSVTDSLVRVARQPVPELLRLAPSGAPRLRADAPRLDQLVRLGFEEVRRDGASRPSFAARLLQLLTALRDLGGERALRCAEIEHQARALRDHAVSLAPVEADAELIEAAFREFQRAEGAEPLGAPSK